MKISSMRNWPSLYERSWPSCAAYSARMHIIALLFTVQPWLTSSACARREPGSCGGDGCGGDCCGGSYWWVGGQSRFVGFQFRLYKLRALASNCAHSPAVTPFPRDAAAGARSLELNQSFTPVTACAEQEPTIQRHLSAEGSGDTISHCLWKRCLSGGKSARRQKTQPKRCTCNTHARTHV